MTAEPTPIRSKDDTFEPHGLGWRAVFCERTVRVTVRRLRHDHGTLRGYVDVEYKAKGTPRSAPSERLAGELLNLSSGRDRASFANRLAERKSGLEWRDIMDRFCVEVERRDDEAEPAVWIGNLPAPIDGGWLVEGLLERRQNNGLHGDGSVGKSWMALALAVSVTAGVEILPSYKPLLRGNVLYLDWETDHDTLNARVKQIARGADIEPPNVLYLRMDSPFADNVERILALCQENDIVLIVIDSVEAAMAGSVSAGGSPNEGPSKINRGLRRLGGVTALLIDHINSDQAQQKGVVRRPYGNIFKRNWVRLAFHLKQSREDAGDGYAHLGLFCAKRNNGKEFDPVGLRWEINDEVCRWTREDIDTPELEDALPTADRIHGYLRREGPSNPSAVAEGTGISGGTVRSTLMRRRDLFGKNGNGLWEALRRQAEDAGGDGEPEELPW